LTRALFVRLNKGMLRPSSALALALALVTPLIAGSAAAQSAPVAPPPVYYPAPPPPYGPVYAPPYAAQPLYPTSALYSPAMLITGVGLHVVGTFAAIFGTIAYLSNDFDRCFPGQFPGQVDSCGPSHGSDTFVMVAGGVGMLAGLPLIVLGSRRVRVKPEDASLVPVITPSMRGASFTFRF
jgi:hypothetical protein